MASASNPKSVLAETETARWKRVRMFSKQGLIRRVAATQGEEADTLVFKVNLRTDEAMRPVGSDVKSMS